jgi:hypothetical protein
VQLSNVRSLDIAINGASGIKEFWQQRNQTLILGPKQEVARRAAGALRFDL